jgi:hypothetical protein
MLNKELWEQFVSKQLLVSIPSLKQYPLSPSLPHTLPFPLCHSQIVECFLFVCVCVCVCVLSREASNY